MALDPVDLDPTALDPIDLGPDGFGPDDKGANGSRTTDLEARNPLIHFGPTVLAPGIWDPKKSLPTLKRVIEDPST